MGPLNVVVAYGGLGFPEILQNSARSLHADGEGLYTQILQTGSLELPLKKMGAIFPIEPGRILACDTGKL